MKDGLNRALAVAGLKLSRIGRDPEHDPNDVATFIPFNKTTAAARAAGLSVDDYVDSVMNKCRGHPSCDRPERNAK